MWFLLYRDHNKTSDQYWWKIQTNYFKQKPEITLAFFIILKCFSKMVECSKYTKFNILSKSSEKQGA